MEVCGMFAYLIKHLYSQYMVSLCRRNYAAHSRDEIFKTLGDVIGGRWKVDLTCPDYVLLVEAIKVSKRNVSSLLV